MSAVLTSAGEPSAADLAAPLDHPLWFRVAGLRARLRGTVRVQRRESRGEVWYLLHNAGDGRHHRVNASAWAFVGCLDGRHPLGPLWQLLHARLGERAPTQAEVLQLLARLAQAELLSTDSLPDLDALMQRQRRTERQRRVARINPLSFRVPLFNPSRLLDRLMPWCAPLLGAGGALAWLALIGGAVALALTRSTELGAAYAAMALTPTTLLTAWLVYPVVKMLHEFGHALLVRRWGGEVREIGVTLMALTPVPYVDASAATRFPQRRRRMAVGAAGIGVELALAAAALWLWAATTDPALRQFALTLVTLCGASSLLFNGNPLLRFDGYHVLGDALDLPNLGQRADAAVLRGARRLLRLPADADDGAAPEALLIAYGLASHGYRLLLGAALIAWLYGLAPLLALAGVAWMAWTQLLQPLRRLAAWLCWSEALASIRLRAVLTTSAAALLAAAAVAFWPAPSASVQQGVLWVPDDAVLRAPVDGTLAGLFGAAGEPVRAGDAVAMLENPALLADLRVARARAAALDVQRFQTLLADPVRASRLTEERDALLAHIERLESRLGELQVRAGIDGTLVLPRAGERDDQFYAQGSEIGYVLPAGDPLVKVALTQAQAALIDAVGDAAGDAVGDAAASPAAGARAVLVRLAALPGREFPGRIERRAAQASTQLPSPLLGEPAGGPVAIDPADRGGRTALQPQVVVDVRVTGLPAAYTQTGLGQRAWVRFAHRPEPLLTQAWRGVRQLFLRSLGAQA